MPVQSVANLEVQVRLVEGSHSFVTSQTHGVAINGLVDEGSTDHGFLGGEVMLADEIECFLSNLVVAARARGIMLHRADVTFDEVQMESCRCLTGAVLIADVEADASDEEIAKLRSEMVRSRIASNTLRCRTLHMCGELSRPG